MMPKKTVYFFPGLGASPKIFEHISLPKDEFDIHFLEWKLPTSLEESLEEYCFRISHEIKEDNPILVGVSFGGIIVQELSKIIPVEKVIIVSSIKTHHELPTRLKLIRDTKAYKLFPAKFAENLEDYLKYFVGDFLEKRAELYKMYLSVRDADYLKWAIYHVLHWKQDEILDNLVHIQGTKDHIFPIKYIEDYISVQDGGHEMILLKAKTISSIISKILT